MKETLSVHEAVQVSARDTSVVVLDFDREKLQQLQRACTGHRRAAGYWAFWGVHGTRYWHVHMSEAKP